MVTADDLIKSGVTRNTATARILADRINAGEVAKAVTIPPGVSSITTPTGTIISTISGRPLAENVGSRVYYAADVVAERIRNDINLIQQGKPAVQTLRGLPAAIDVFRKPASDVLTKPPTDPTITNKQDTQQEQQGGTQTGGGGLSGLRTPIPEDSTITTAGNETTAITTAGEVIPLSDTQLTPEDSKDLIKLFNKDSILPLVIVFAIGAGLLLSFLTEHKSYGKIISKEIVV